MQTDYSNTPNPNRSSGSGSVQRPPSSSGSHNPKSPKSRSLRYDRILAVIVVIILLLVLMVKCCSSCGSDDEVATTSTSASDVTDTTTVTEATESVDSQYTGAIYLSPSNQSDNTFATGDTNEAEVCRDIAEKTAALLEGAGLTVFIASENDSIQTKTSVGDYPLAAYVGIQTNQGTGSGTSCYYNSASAESQSLAQCVYDPVAFLTERDDNGLIDGSDTTSDYYQYEIAENNSPSCLIEVEFHDTTTVAQWILDNEDSIANAIASGICSYLGVTYTSSSTASSSTDDTDYSSTDDADSSSNAIEDQLNQ
ncbi:MAG: N-acetylmuramoyl-L-alanine amidase [Ruminococcus sp.]|nr:N-acetylmuramoyl-L-alanine amidase [Ruminococcus sp.]